ncbi:energy-coupling factor transport system ATP-binding protein [Neobacillus niacini]|uniref:ABC transporter ATP-binding protein n=1 Tax=Neobacillus niacini TaxID=86668 RepID=UPI00285F2B6F|nr:energy-coupling factor transporter ATPase [Neobacillus niacini]MDR7079386.1 energy-coupling factor transport system ATP-binding protein [Neobacillus niacini]
MSKPIVEIHNVTFQYPGNDTKVLNEANLTVEEGDFLAIIGGNGSGKSTLCKTINGLIPKFYVGEFEGEVVIDGLTASEHDVATLSKSIGYVYQDFENQLLRPTVLDDASFVPLNYGFADFKERGNWALQVTGLSHLAKEFVWQLSGGQKHLLALAGAIAMKPKILIIDEPIAQLDPQHAKTIYDVLKTLNEEYGTTIIVIEHYTEFIAAYCKQVVLMDQGRVCWKKDVRAALSSVEELLTQQIFPPQVTLAAHYLNRDYNYPITLDEAIDYFSGDSPEFQTLPKPIKNEMVPVLVLRNVSVRYRTFHKQTKDALHQVSTTFYKGDQVALVGNNGAGKSTLLKVLGGIVKPTEGVMELSENPLKKFTPETLSDTLAFVFQNAEEMFIDDSVRKEIEYYLKARKVGNLSSLVDQILEDFDLVDYQNQDARLLSGGQQRRVSLAIGAAMRPSIIILDEPTANLDMATKSNVVMMLENLKKHVDTIIIATHDMQLVAEWANRMLVMHDGELIADDGSEVIFKQQEILNRAGLVPPQLIRLCNQLNFPYCATIDSFVECWKQAEQQGA